MNAQEYLKLAEVEDRMWHFRSLHAHVERGLESAGLAEGAEVLDAGCGTGGLILRAQGWRRKYRWAGLDFMELACDLARQRCGAGVDIHRGSVTALPFAEASFDAVASIDVICQVDDPAVAIREFFRVLRPGGAVVINVPAYRWMWSYHDDTVHTKHRFVRREIADLLRGGGWQLQTLTHWNALPFPLIWAKRKMFRTDDDTSDVKEYPWLVDLVLGAMMRVEHAWLRLGGTWAWGTSVFAVARKP